MLGKLGPAIQQARKLTAYPKGRFPPPVIARDFFDTDIGHLHSARHVATLLFLDALQQTEQGNYQKAWASAIAALNAGRSLGDEPVFLSPALRRYCRARAVGAMERILAQGEVDDKALAEGSARLRSEIGTPLLLFVLRGMRAGQHLFYTRLAAKEFNLGDLPHLANQPEVRQILAEVDDVVITRSHAYTLRVLTKAVECAKKAPPQRYHCTGDLANQIKTAIVEKTIPPLARALTPAVDRIAVAEQDSDPLLECAVTALAAERFRLRAKRWPKDLAELVTARLLPKVPMDYDGKPLTLRHAKDGLVVYSRVTGDSYEGTRWDNLQEPPLNLERVEFRLWDPAHRRQPAPPPPPPDEPEA
jgi:hypothetical protein